MANLHLVIWKKGASERMRAEEKETYEGLREAGLSLNFGKDGSGQYRMDFERFEALELSRLFSKQCGHIGCTPYAFAGLAVGLAELICSDSENQAGRRDQEICSLEHPLSRASLIREYSRHRPSNVAIVLHDLAALSPVEQEPPPQI
ncbi:hypothetical protein B0H19DRAFT_1073747 [Mycena capillaripes]|nr:hypothetical protein B0H19DRAFT_1073747 [Mycena capillaripes]